MHDDILISVTLDTGAILSIERRGAAFIYALRALGCDELSIKRFDNVRDALGALHSQVIADIVVPLEE